MIGICSAGRMQPLIIDGRLRHNAEATSLIGQPFWTTSEPPHHKTDATSLIRQPFWTTSQRNDKPDSLQRSTESPRVKTTPKQKKRPNDKLEVPAPLSRIQASFHRAEAKRLTHLLLAREKSKTPPDSKEHNDKASAEAQHTRW
eukprot:CAMPEP_0118956624 /NCGR_PEP_ID=MMETSP1169-20130426/61677_1 /TAXON_ID=36882 /ORGANISM="Pyramimonas obovata, Strain CCMP722" /LENGTH=143 /DNA_ID=CAMNT_0006904661 /DNA_START=1355 /DNA_END=1783 /DNA_ORIENTATION=-